MYRKTAPRRNGSRATSRENTALPSVNVSRPAIALERFTQRLARRTGLPVGIVREHVALAGLGEGAHHG